MNLIQKLLDVFGLSKTISPIQEEQTPDYRAVWSTPTPTPTATPTPTPLSQYAPVAPIVPQNIASTYYTNRNQAIKPDVWDAILNSPTTDYIKRLILALTTQESSGGYRQVGDEGRAFGPYHIRPDIRTNITKEQALDPNYATEYLVNEIQRNIDAGLEPYQALGSWNSRSVNPDYTRDLPQMATTSSFYRGK